MALTDEQINALEASFDLRFGSTGWGVDTYPSPSERKINKPILPETDRTTNRMGHARNWEQADATAVEVWFKDGAQHRHTAVFTDIELALLWLNRQDTSGVVNV